VLLRSLPAIIGYLLTAVVAMALVRYATDLATSHFSSGNTVLREVAYFPWVGSHSTSNQFVHAMHHLFTWMTEHPHHPVAHRQALVDDALLRQRFVHESLRLHPASPVSLRHALADVTLRSGTEIPAGSMVSISLLDANRDPAVFGERPDEFDPFRTLADGATPWGLSFGHGLHACLGQELAGGVEPAPAGADALEQHLLGSIAVMAGIVLAAGAVPDPDDPPVPSLRGIGRVLTSADAMERAIALADSPAVGMTFCQGSLKTMGEDVPACIRRFKDRIAFIHVRDVRGTASRFEETFPDDGDTDMAAVFRAYAAAGLDVPIRPDHAPAMDGDAAHDGPVHGINVGYEANGMIFTVGYMKGLMQATGIHWSLGDHR
jgi:hypothetical protein